MKLKWAPKGGFGVPLSDNMNIIAFALIEDGSDQYLACVSPSNWALYINRLINPNAFEGIRFTTMNLEKIEDDNVFYSIISFLRAEGFEEFIDGIKEEYLSGSDFVGPGSTAANTGIVH